jgi:hypothetical protein
MAPDNLKKYLSTFSLCFIALEAVRLDDEALDWVVQALKESHGTKKQYHKEMISKLQAQHKKLQNRLDGLYVDKLDGVISREFYNETSVKWRLEQENILRKIENHQNANQSYLDSGIQVLELTQNAVRLYEKQEMRAK